MTGTPDLPKLGQEIVYNSLLEGCVKACQAQSMFIEYHGVMTATKLQTDRICQVSKLYCFKRSFAQTDDNPMVRTLLGGDGDGGQTYKFDLLPQFVSGPLPSSDGLAQRRRVICSWACGCSRRCGRSMYVPRP